VAFDLVEEAAGMAKGDGGMVMGLFAGCAVFFCGDWLIDRSGGSKRKDPAGAQGSGSAMAIVLGSVLDGDSQSRWQSTHSTEASSRPSRETGDRSSPFRRRREQRATGRGMDAPACALPLDSHRRLHVHPVWTR